MNQNSLRPTEITNVTSFNICSVAFTPDGKHVISGDSAGGGIRRWTIQDAQQVGATMTASNQVTAIAVSKDGKWIVTGDSCGRVVVWNAATHQRAVDIPYNLRSVWAVDIASDSARIATASNDSTVRMFNITAGSQLLSIPHNNIVTGVKFSPTGDRIATAVHDRPSVRIYNSLYGNLLFEIPIQVQAYPITPFAWSPDGQQLFAISPGKITSINTSTAARSEWSIHNTDPQASIVSNGKFIACSAGSSVSLWDTLSHKQIGVTLGHSATIQCIALCPEEGYIACGHGNKISFHELHDILPRPYFWPPPSRPPLMEVNIPVIDSWKQPEEDPENTETILTEEITLSNPTHYTNANRALIRARLRRWHAAIEDANSSLKNKPSPIGHIAKALTLVGLGEKNLALSEFDFAFSVCDPKDIKFLLVIKSILVFVGGDHEDAIFRINGLVPNVDKDTNTYCIQVLGNMYLKKGDYEGAIRSLQGTPRLVSPEEIPQLTTISLIFGWSFSGIEAAAWARMCENLYASGCIKGLGESLIKMDNSLAEDEREAAHCRLLEEVVTRSGDVTLLRWTGKAAAYNSCLPASPAVYTQEMVTPQTLEGDEMKSRISKLRKSLPQTDALIIHDWVSRIQPVRFANRHLHLPCLPFRVLNLSKQKANTYRAKVAWLGEVGFTTEDRLPVNAPRRLVFVHPWIRWLRNLNGKVTSKDECKSDEDMNSSAGLGSDSDVDIDAEIVHAPLEEETSYRYAQALQLIARLGQPFTALLLLKQSDGTYKRVAATHEIIVPGLGSNIPKDIRAEVLEVV